MNGASFHKISSSVLKWNVQQSWLSRKNLETIKHQENIKQNLILNRQIWDFWMCLTKGVGESMVGYCALFFLVGGYMRDSLQGSIICFWDFHFQDSIQAYLIFTPLF